MATPILINQFPALSVRIRIQIAWGADLTADEATWTWTDITSDVQYKQRVEMIIGRADEFAKPQPASLKLTVDNRAGKYSKGGQSPNYPNVKKNTPIRVQISTDSGATWPYTRFQGEILTFTPKWDSTGRNAETNIVAAGARRRLEQHEQPVKSALRRYTEQAANVIHYWPLEDGAEQRAATAAIGDLPLPFYNVINVPEAKTFFDLDQGSNPLVSSDGVVGFQSGAGLFLKAPTDTTSSKWALLFAYRTAGKVHSDSLASDVVEGFGLYINGQVQNYQVIIQTGFTIADKEALYMFMGPSLTQEWKMDPPEFLGQWHWCELWITNRGTTNQQDYRFSVDDQAKIGLRTEIPLGKINDIEVVSDSLASTPVPQGMGHFIVLNAGVNEYDPGFYQAFLGNPNEYVHTRLARLAAENGEILTVVGTSEVTCGPQTVDTLINLLDDAAGVDGGILYDGVSRGLTYVCRTERENIAATLTLNASTGQIEDPIMPIDDDQGVLNSFTATKTNGAAITYTRTDGDLGTDAIGSYSGSANLNFADGTRQTQDYASWQVHLGTDPGTLYRWPSVSIALHNNPSLLATWLGLGLLDRVDITNISTVRTQQPSDSVKLLAEGWRETIDQFMWDIELNTSPYLPWRVGELINAVTDVNPDAIRLEPDLSVVTTGCAAGGTSIVVTTTGIARWADDATFPNDFPMDLDIGGMTVTCTGITVGSGGVQTFTLTGSTVKYAIPTGLRVQIAEPGYLGQVAQ